MGGVAQVDDLLQVRPQLELDAEAREQRPGARPRSEHRDVGLDGPAVLAGEPHAGRRRLDLPHRTSDLEPAAVALEERGLRLEAGRREHRPRLGLPHGAPAVGPQAGDAAAHVAGLQHLVLDALGRQRRDHLLEPRAVAPQKPAAQEDLTPAAALQALHGLDAAQAQAHAQGVGMREAPEAGRPRRRGEGVADAVAVEQDDVVPARGELGGGRQPPRTGTHDGAAH